ncbi:CAP domain-containing protein [Patescibacteria group bacterium]|nr:CAP domain-containing protein [Patescibacteria group bacterium]
MRFLGKKYLYFYTIISAILLIVLSPISSVKINNLLANLTQKLIVQEVNPVRETYGFLKLETNKKLTKAAQMKAQDMVKRDYFDHLGPEGETPWSWLEKADYEYAAAGENLAMDCNDPVILINAWMNSPSHARNILNGYFTDIGIGIAEGVIDGRKTTVVVMFLGRERTVSLGMATNISDDYKEIIISETKSAKPQTLSIAKEEVRPEEPLVVKVVEEEDLYKENLFLAIAEQEKGVGTENSNPQKTVYQMALIGETPEMFRVFLTCLYAGLIFFGLVDMLIRKERNTTLIAQSIFVLILTTIIWIP